MTRCTAEEARALMLHADTKGPKWWPLDANWEAAKEQYGRLRHTLEHTLSLPPQEFSLSWWQDSATYHAFGVPAEVACTANQVWVHVSKFSPLSSYWEVVPVNPRLRVATQAGIPQTTRTLIEDALTSHGYQVISTEDLNRPYDGQVEGIRNYAGNSWKYRFFDTY